MIGAALLVGAILAIRNVIRRYRAAVLAAAELKRKQKQQVNQAIQQVQTCLFPLCVAKFSDFKSLGRLTSHEQCRDTGILKILDTWELACEFAASHRILFVSHQACPTVHPSATRHVPPRAHTAPPQHTPPQHLSVYPPRAPPPYSSLLLLALPQWLGLDKPDPDNVHYPVIVKAAEKLCTEFE